MSKGRGNWGTVRVPREDWGRLRKSLIPLKNPISNTWWLINMVIESLPRIGLWDPFHSWPFFG